MEKARHTAHVGDRRTRSFSGGVIHALFFSLLAGTALVLIFSFLLYRLPDRAELITPLGYVGSGLLALLGGICGSRRLGRSGALCGLSAGILIVFLFTLVALILRGGTLPTAAIPLYLLILAASTVGGGVGTKKPKRRKRR